MSPSPSRISGARSPHSDRETALGFVYPVGPVSPQRALNAYFENARFMGLFSGAWAVGCAVVILCLFARDRSQRFARGQQCENAHCELCVARFTRKNSVKENYRSVSTCPSMGGSDVCQDAKDHRTRRRMEFDQSLSRLRGARPISSTIGQTPVPCRCSVDRD